MGDWTFERVDELPAATVVTWRKYWNRPELDALLDLAQAHIVTNIKGAAGTRSTVKKNLIVPLEKEEQRPLTLAELQRMGFKKSNG